MALRPTGPPPTSPRSNLSRLLSITLGVDTTQSQPELQSQMDILMQADAENKVRNRKLYLILDLDETLVYSQRLKPGAVPAGIQIIVHNQPFDMVLRPGLEHFLRVIQKTYVVFMYTMGDDAYAHAVLDAIDPHRQYFRGGVCAWRHSESREFKYMSRIACDKNMAVIIDDSIDVWRGSLPNLCLTRRFVGDPMDDGLQLLSWMLQQLHSGYYAALGPEGPMLSTPSVLTTLRGTLLEGCVIAFTGLVSDQSEEVLKNQPLCGLVRLYGAEVTLDVDDATHLVARKKEGWKSASKIRRALQRQETDPSFRAVWDHWLLDSICTFKRQSEINYAVRLDEEEVEYIVPGRLEAIAPAPAPTPPAIADDGGGRLSDILGAVSKTQMRVQPAAVGELPRHAALDSPGISLSAAAPTLPLRKRPREAEEGPPRREKDRARMSVSDYLKSKTAPPG